MRAIKSICKKDGNEILQKFVDVIYSIKSTISINGTYRFHFKSWRGRGRNISLSDCEHRNCEDLFSALGIAYNTGNDAPRGGVAGDFIEVSDGKSAKKLDTFIACLRYEETRGHFNYKNQIFFK